MLLGPTIICIRSFPILQSASSYVFGIFLLFCVHNHVLNLFLYSSTHHQMCLVYSFRSVCVIIFVWHIPFVLYASSYLLGLFLSFCMYYHMSWTYCFHIFIIYVRLVVFLSTRALLQSIINHA